MAHDRSTDTPVLQRLYDRIWLLAAAAMAFFFTMYVVWGVIDVIAVTAG